MIHNTTFKGKGAKQRLFKMLEVLKILLGVLVIHKKFVGFLK